MQRTGTATLPLHYGTAPRWLFGRMVKLADGIVRIMVDEYGAEEFLKRISDPFWFQSFSCVLGFDWHSSGTTTVTCGALKQVLSPGIGVVVAGGKGRASRKSLSDIEKYAEIFDLDAEKFRYLSRMTAKVDNTALQDGHQLYHHSFFITRDGKWAVVQQGMNPEQQTARRYHWFSENVKNVVVEPHNAILGDSKIENVLDMTAKKSEEARKTSVDLGKEKPVKLKNLIKSMRKPYQKGLEEYIHTDVKRTKLSNMKFICEVLTEKPSVAEFTETLSMPKRINWEIMKKVYDFQPRNYEEFLSIKGVGPGTVRALALISDLIYGKKPSWKDPVKYSFTVGGKDGVPYPVNRKVMDKSIEILRQGIEESKIGRNEKIDALRRLRKILPG